MQKHILDLDHEVRNDAALRDMLDYGLEFRDLLKLYSSADFLTIDDDMEVPFFAVTRDYVGAYDRKKPESKWIVKRIEAESEKQFRLAMIAYFINYFTGNVSAPTILTTIDGELYRASKLMHHTEQLSGAPYLEDKRMRAQLANDLINSWIFFDEDRNPNNYLIYYSKSNCPIVISIDFSNIDLESEGQIIKGVSDTFGWERHGKTRYMTPLKTELLYHYSWEFFEERFARFSSLDPEILSLIADSAFRGSALPGLGPLKKKIAANIVRRRDYVQSYFKEWFADPEKLAKLQQRSFGQMHDEYSVMGRTFNDLQKDYENDR